MTGVQTCALPILDHLLSKEEEVEVLYTVEFSSSDTSGVDALRGHTRSHPEHDG